MLQCQLERRNLDSKPAQTVTEILSAEIILGRCYISSLCGDKQCIVSCSKLSGREVQLSADFFVFFYQADKYLQLNKKRSKR
jgi:hypothetical protein